MTLDINEWNEKPKIITEIYYKSTKNLDSIKSLLDRKFIYTYDEFERLTNLKTIYSIDSTITINVDYKYNKKDLLESKSISFIKNDSTYNNSKSIYTYNKNKLLVKVESFSNYKRDILRTIEYNKNCNILRIISKYKDGTFHFKSIKRLNKMKKVIQLDNYNRANKLTSTYCFKYDKNGNQILLEQFNNENKLYEMDKSEYDKHNNRIKYENFIILRKDTIKNYESSTLDVYYNKGNKINEKVVINSKDTIITNYFYDKFNNIKTIKKLKNNNEHSLIEYKIIYY